MPTATGHPHELAPVRPPALIVPSAPAHVPGEGEEGADAPGGLSPAKMLHALRRTWLIGLPLAIAAAVGAYLVAETRITPSYTARTMLHVSPVRPSILYDVPGRVDSANPQRTQIAMVKSRFVIQAALRDLEPLNLPALRNNPDPVVWLEKEIVADYSVAPEILRITLKGSDSEQVLAILTGVREAYLREVLNKDRTTQMSQLKQLGEVAAKHDATLKSLGLKLERGVQALGARDLATLRTKCDLLNGWTQALRGELSYYQSLLKRIELAAAPAAEPGAAAAAVETALEEAFAADAVAAKFRESITRVEKKAADYKLKLKNYEADPDYQLLADELAGLRASLAGRRDELQAAAVAQAGVGTRAQKARDAAANERLTANIKDYLPQLEEQIRQHERDAAALSRGIVDLDVVRSDIAQEEELFKKVKADIRFQETELQAPPRARVIEEAAIVEVPRPDKSMKLLAGSAAGAFLAVLGFVAWLDLRRGRVDGATDLEAGRIRVIGAVPSVRDGVLGAFTPPAKSSARRDYLRLADAVEMARAVITPVLAAGPGYTLAVASAVAGEGKTVLAGHLAVRFARSGRRTLLIDTDVRRPRTHQLFGLPAGPGFGECVTGGMILAEVVVPGPAPDLHVVPAGTSDPHAVAELLDRRLPELLAAVRGEYDVIVLDTAPLLCTPESLVLARAADGVVLSVMRDVSRVADVLAGHERLLSASARVLGAVVTGESTARYARY